MRIGVFDSGYGGLTILEQFRALLPEYDYVYLGDNARTPYGTRSFEVVYQYTLECVKKLFEMDCALVILACNTASAKALRTIQQKDLPSIAPDRRVLGVIRPTAEAVGLHTQSNHIGLLGTEGTIQSGSYPMEISKLYPHITVVGQACPMWVPLIENNEHNSHGADYFVKKYIDKLLQNDPKIDTLVLACTHYPLLLQQIKKHVPEHMQIISQGTIIAQSLKDYLDRHPEMDSRLDKKGICTFYTTESVEKFKQSASTFLHESIEAHHLSW
ncbi:MAG: glutamate racemase [Paludibacteraceae bacterium]|mgnify:FL=1|jgi:glutamate racemase|nr:glutamate racemase [Paludibacteraceae bacterium]